MLIAQISDAHISAPGQLTCGVAPMDKNLAACVDSINHLSRAPDLVVVSGDITNGGRPEEARHAAAILSALDCPYYIVPGNHDDRATLWDQFAGTACPDKADGFIAYVVKGHPLQVIALDSTATGQSGGEICCRRAAWLRARLTAANGAPVVIFMHHPPLPLGVPETDIDGFANAAVLGGIVRDFPNIERILCGHIHLETHSRWCGTVVTTAPSPGMQLTLDLTQAEPSKFLLSAPAYLLHHWTQGKTLVTHSVHLSGLSGPYPFT